MNSPVVVMPLATLREPMVAVPVTSIPITAASAWIVPLMACATSHQTGACGSDDTLNFMRGTSPLMVRGGTGSVGDPLGSIQNWPRTETGSGALVLRKFSRRNARFSFSASP